MIVILTRDVQDISSKSWVKQNQIDISTDETRALLVVDERLMRRVNHDVNISKNGQKRVMLLKFNFLITFFKRTVIIAVAAM